MIMTSKSVPTPEQISAKLKAGRSGTPPLFPVNWQASFVLSPFGDAKPPAGMKNYDQLVVANITCYDDPLVGSAMRVGLYLLEDLQYFDFVFIDSGQWYWLNNAPGEEPTDYYGPFSTTLQAPTLGFLSQAVYGGQWPLAGTLTDGWMVPTVDSTLPPHGNWISLRSEDQALWRVINLDSNNPMNLPILGSYFMANTSNYTTFTPPPGVLLPPTLQALLKRPPKAQVSAPSSMVTQRDIQTAMANPLFSSPCTLEQIQALVPGITQPQNLPLPQWTNQVYINGWSLGYDAYPYPTHVWYDYNIPCQRSEFDGFGNGAGNNSPNVRQDTVLYASYFDNPIYQWQSGAWQLNCCNPRADGIGVPRPDFLASSNGAIKATIVGNPSFGLSSGETLLITRATMLRDTDPDPKVAPILSVFWLWFMADWQGVFFSECNYVNSVTEHELFTIDYGEFVQNAPIDPSSDFTDPCAQSNPPMCPDNLKAQHSGKRRRAPLVVAQAAKR
jgi:hypothetical protein